MTERRPRRNLPLSYRGVGGREALGAAALLVAAALVLLWVARGQGTTRTIKDIVPYEERGVFDYSTALGRNIYDDDLLRVPQPLFRRLGERLPLTYTYEVNSLGPGSAIEGAHGSYFLTTEVRQANGWVRTVPLVPRTDFQGAGFKTQGVIDVTALAEFIRRLESETGYKAPQFTVRVRAHVEFEGALRGERIERALDQTLGFSLSEFELRLEKEGTELDRVEPGEVQFEKVVPRTLAVPLIGVDVSVAQVPRLAWLLMGAGVVLAALVGQATVLDLLFHPAGAGPPPIPARYRDRVIDVDPHSEPPPGARVHLHDLPSLLRLAEQYQSPVLRSLRGGEATYWVVADSVYVLAEGSTAASEAPREAAAERSASVVAPAATQTGLAVTGVAPAVAPPTPITTDTPALVFRLSRPSISPPAEEVEEVERDEPEEDVAVPQPVTPRLRDATKWFAVTAPPQVVYTPEGGSLGLGSGGLRAVRPIAAELEEEATEPELEESPRDVAAPRSSPVTAWFGLVESEEAAGDWDEIDAGTLGLTSGRPRALRELDVSRLTAPEASTPTRVYWGGVWRDEGDEPSEVAA